MKIKHYHKGSAFLLPTRGKNADNTYSKEDNTVSQKGENQGNNNQGTNNQGTNNNSSNGNENRTFTQAELDAIVQDRLRRERDKYADYETLKDKAAKFDQTEEASKTELQKAQDQANSYKAELEKLKKGAKIREIREKVAKDTGVPASLLSADTEEVCKEQAKQILDFAKPGAYPSVRDGGEQGSNTGSGDVADQFANWMKQQQF